MSVLCKRDSSSLVSLVSGAKYGNRLRYAAVVVNTSLTGSTLKYKQGNDVYNSWEKLVNEEVCVDFLFIYFLFLFS